MTSLLTTATTKGRMMKRLTFDGVNDLYMTVHGAVTLERAKELDELLAKYWQNIPKVSAPIEISDELAARNERCIDLYGCGEF